MERQTVLAVVICFLIFLGWQKFYLEPRLPQQQVQQQAPSSSGSGAANTQPTQQGNVAPGNQNSGTFAGGAFNNQQANRAPRVPKASEKKEIRLNNSTLTIGNAGQFVEGWKLGNYRVSRSETANPVDLMHVAIRDQQIQLSFDHPTLSNAAQALGTIVENGSRIEWRFEDKNLKLVREFYAGPDQSYVDVIINGEFKGSERPRFAFVSLTGRTLGSDDPEAIDRKLIYFTDGATDEQLLNDIEFESIPSNLDWIAVANRYFALSLVPQAGVLPQGLIQPIQAGGRLSMVYPITSNVFSIPFRAYFGAKEITALNAVSPKLEGLVDLGWFAGVALFCLKVLKWFYQFTLNYGVAIILLTVAVKIVTYPLTYKSMKSMKAMAKHAPELKKLQEKYKGDREALNREMMVFMKTKGYNPLAGCWPILIQMPIFIALYRVLYSSVELYQAPFALWITDLSAKDPYYVFPVLVGATWWLQQKLSPQTITDPTQQKIMQFMPVIFSIFMLTLPSGLSLYFFVNAALSIVQQLILNKKFEHEMPMNGKPATAS